MGNHYICETCSRRNECEVFEKLMCFAATINMIGGMEISIGMAKCLGYTDKEDK